MITTVSKFENRQFKFTYFRKHSYSSELVLFKTHIELANMIAQAIGPTVERKRLTTTCSGHTDSYTDASNGSNRVIYNYTPTILEGSGHTPTVRVIYTEDLGYRPLHRRFGSYTECSGHIEGSGCFCPAVVSTVYHRPTPHLGRIQIDVLFMCFEHFYHGISIR